MKVGSLCDRCTYRVPIGTVDWCDKYDIDLDIFDVVEECAGFEEKHD